MNKLPKLYLLSTIMVVIALILIAYTQMHFAIVFMIFGALAYLPNFWIGSHYGLKVTLFLKKFYPELYNKNKSNYKYKGVYLISRRVAKKKSVLDKLDKEHQYALKKYAEAVGNIIYTFILIVLSLIYASYFILN